VMLTGAGQGVEDSRRPAAAVTSQEDPVPAVAARRALLDRPAGRASRPPPTAWPRDRSARPTVRPFDVRPGRRSPLVGWSPLDLGGVRVRPDRGRSGACMSTVLTSRVDGSSSIGASWQSRMLRQEVAQDCARTGRRPRAMDETSAGRSPSFCDQSHAGATMVT
jgi:hypothetical protein